MEFQYPIHNQVLQVLQAVNRDFFQDCSIAFGGGTMLALAYGEYRLSRDIDFICPYGEAFSKLRRSVFDHGYEAIFDFDRCNNITLEPALQTDWSPVACLSLVDQVTEKLLANGDRWADRSVDSRDLIDLAILKLKTSFPERALEKAEAAYPTVEPLKRSILSFQARPDYRARCYERLQIASPSIVIDGLDLLAKQFELPLFERTEVEH